MKGSTRKLRKNLKDSWKLMRMKMQPFKIFGCSKSSPEGEIHRNTSIHPKTGKNSNTRANLAPKGAGEGTANKTFTQQKKTVNKDSSRIQ